MNIRVATVSPSLSVQSHRGVIAEPLPPPLQIDDMSVASPLLPRPVALVLTFARTASCLICRLGMQNANIINLPENYTFKYCASPLLSASSSAELTPSPFIRPPCCLQTSTTP